MSLIDNISTMILWIINCSILAAICYWFLIGIMLNLPVHILDRNKLYYRCYIKFIFVVAWIYALLTRGQVVYLLDYTKSFYISVAYDQFDGTSQAYVYFFTRVGPVTLLPHGLLLEKNDEYIHKWLPYNKYRRLEMILKYDLENFI